MTQQGTARSVQVRLYMEGRLVENAFVSTVVSGGQGRPSTAQIELVPTNTIKHILPFTWIHIFATDPWDPAPTGGLDDFKLLFEGVVISRGFTRAESGRNFVVQCADPSIFWTRAKQFWLNFASANGGLVDQLAVQTSGGYGRFGKIGTEGYYGYLSSKLAFADKEQPEERFMDTLISVLDDIGNVNPFYTNARNRFRITDRILRGPAGKTEKLFQLAMISDFLDGLASRVSGQSNLVDVVNQILDAIFHEWISVPAPAFVKTRIFDRDVFGNVKRIKNTVKDRGPEGGETVDLFDVKTAVDDVIGTFIFKPHLYTVAPPNCNVLFPSMYEKTTHVESFLDDVTRLSMKPTLPLVGDGMTMGLLFQRPTELEVFTALVRDPARNASGKRTPDGVYGDAAGQTPTFSDYDWTTNEERIRGLVYSFMNLAPAPAALTLSDPGRRTPAGTREGGLPKYLQNVASYEWYKARYASRQSELSGPFNMRPVPGFPLVALDDSPAGLSLVADLEGITHHIRAGGEATTHYSIRFARLVDEVDLNRPKFIGGYKNEKTEEYNLDLIRDENGQYDFKKIFDGTNHPPIPEWFDQSYRNPADLDIKYRSWFGEKAGVMQNFLFKDPGKKPDKVLRDLVTSEGINLNVFDLATIAERTRLLQARAKEYEDIVEQNDKITIEEAVKALNDRYRKARGVGREFSEVAQLTQRSFTKIDEAFRFVGASPVEYADNQPSAPETPSDSDQPVTFSKNPARGRKIDYAHARFDLFAGDTSIGSGYSAAPEGVQLPTPVTTPPQDIQVQGVDTISSASPLLSVDRMSGAFPVFDTRTHSGQEATDATARANVAAQERGPSNYARYDGRPIMFDFEFRIWQESLAKAGYAPGEAPDSLNAEYVVKDGAAVRPKTPAELAADAQRRREAVAARDKEDELKRARGKSVPTDKKRTSMRAADQAPTGDGLEENRRDPVPQPLSEKQVIDIRRSIVDAYRAELARTRGFEG